MRVFHTSSLSRPARRVLAFVGCVTLLAAGGLSLGGCSVFQQPVQVRGNKIDPDQLKELVPGTSARKDVTALLGSPTTKATFDDNTWIYVGQRTRPIIAGTNLVITQEVVQLTFDQSGILRDIKSLDKADALPVSVVARATPAPGNDSSILQQLLGNVGRYNAGTGSATGSFNSLGSGSGLPTGGAPIDGAQ